MIFVTVGTQLPFDRLVSAVDVWAETNAITTVFGQIGHGNYSPKNFPTEPFVTKQDADKYFQQADCVVAHAGMGSILTALKYKKPIIVLPRLAKLQEHRNDHQLASVKQFADVPGVMVAEDEAQLFQYLSDVRKLRYEKMTVNEFASEELLNNLSNFINSNETSSMFKPTFKRTDDQLLADNNPSVVKTWESAADSTVY